MKILKVIAEQTITINNNTFFVELKKVVKSNVIVRSADKRAGTYKDNNYLSTVAFVNGDNYMACNCIDTVIKELQNGGYTFFIK